MLNIRSIIQSILIVCEASELGVCYVDLSCNQNEFK